jgi:PAS domain S-box-containing protein
VADPYRSLFEAAADALVLIDNATGQILEVNVAATTLYGYSRDALLQLKHTDLSAEPDQTRQATAEAQPRVPLRYHRTQHGTVFPVEITACHLLWAGRPVHLAAIRDITPRVQAEAVLAAHTRQLEAEMTARTQSETRFARSEAWLCLAHATAGAGTWEWDLQTNENRWSDELWPLYGLAPHSSPPPTRPGGRRSTPTTGPGPSRRCRRQPSRARN